MEESIIHKLRFIIIIGSSEKIGKFNPFDRNIKTNPIILPF